MRTSKAFARAGTAIGMLVALLSSTPALAASIDLSTWLEEGPGGGTWTVQGGGNSVLQSVNSATPTFFISDNSFINKTFKGTFAVESAGDNDFIGFVFGYTKPFAAAADATTDFDFLLFDWKQADQGSATAGMHLTQVTGDFSDNVINHSNITAANAFWSHVEASGTDANSTFDVLASDTGAGKGWADNTEYEFTVDYTDDRVRLFLKGGMFSNVGDGDLIFDVGGTFGAGSFGFYNFSQANVRYAGITQEDAPDLPPLPEPATLGLLSLGLLALVRRRGRG